MTSFRDQAKEVLIMTVGENPGGFLIDNWADMAADGLEEAHKADILSRLPTTRTTDWIDSTPDDVRGYNECLAEIKKQLEIG